MKHAVLGAGGVGGLIAAALAAAGHPVVLLVRDPAHPVAIRLESVVLGEIVTTVEVATALDRPVDILWIAVKSQQLEGALAAVPEPGLAGHVVPLLNGIEHVARLATIHGPERVLPGTIGVESERREPGLYRQLSPFIRVEIAGPGAAAPARELAATGIDATAVEDATSMLWRKLLMLAPLALTTTGLQASLGVVRQDPAWRGRLLAAIEEVAAVGRAEGARLDPAATRELLLRAPDAMRSSMQKDRAAGRPLELDAIAGAVQRAGLRHGVPTPTIDGLANEIGGARS